MKFTWRKKEYILIHKEDYKYALHFVRPDGKLGKLFMNVCIVNKDNYEEELKELFRVFERNRKQQTVKVIVSTNGMSGDWVDRQEKLIREHMKNDRMTRSQAEDYCDDVYL